MEPFDYNDRRTFIGSTDVKRIMDGDWHSLWLEKTGRAVPEFDEKIRFKMDLGTLTEPFNLAKRAEQLGTTIMPGSYQQQFRFLDDLMPLRMATAIDCMMQLPKGPLAIVDAKHTSSFMSAHDLWNRYFWQAQHHLWLANMDHWMMSPIYGNDFGDPIMIEKDPHQQQSMIQYSRQFWEHVVQDREPSDVGGVEAPKAHTANEVWTEVICAQDTNMWHDWMAAAPIWPDLKTQADAFKETDTELKNMMRDDAVLMYGDGICVERNKRGHKQVKHFTLKVAEKYLTSAELAAAIEAGHIMEE